jgi:hypothetical protein
VAKYEPQPPTIYHYTNKKGYNAIKATPEWCFKSLQPAAPEHEVGAYFTNCAPNEPNLSIKIRVPKEKLEYMFSFVDVGDLLPLRGWRGQGVFFSRTDYRVARVRQNFHGPREGWR